MSVSSILTGGPAVKVGELDKARLIAAYAREHDADISPFLAGVETIERWRCEETGLEFFRPGGLAGPPAFYEMLYSRDAEQKDYNERRWEFSRARDWVRGAEAVLDVGCGFGYFLDLARDDIGRSVGLETNAFSRSNAQSRNLTVVDQTIEQHAEEHPEAYDAVASFQVLEHVDDPRSFINSMLRALRPGGTLVLSVPNNDSFLSDCPLLPLNSPPHHVTLWGWKTLETLERFFDIKLVSIEKEPLSKACIGWYQSVMEEKYLPKSRLLRSLYYRLGGGNAFRRYLEDVHETIDGHTIMAKYQKT